MPMPAGFRWKGNGSKIECLDCGRSGYPGGAWLIPCTKGHPFECDTCGRRGATKAAISTHLRTAHPVTPVPEGVERAIEAQLRHLGGARAYLAGIFGIDPTPTDRNTLAH